MPLKAVQLRPVLGHTEAIACLSRVVLTSPKTRFSAGKPFSKVHGLPKAASTLRILRASFHAYRDPLFVGTRWVTVMRGDALMTTGEALFMRHAQQQPVPC